MTAIANPCVANAMRFIREHACQGIGVDDVLEHLTVSRSVLQRLFRNELGQTILDAITAIRMQRVKQLLTETDLSLDRHRRPCRLFLRGVSEHELPAADRSVSQLLSTEVQAGRLGPIVAMAWQVAGRAERVTRHHGGCDFSSGIARTEFASNEGMSNSLFVRSMLMSAGVTSPSRKTETVPSSPRGKPCPPRRRRSRGCLRRRSRHRRASRIAGRARA